MTKPKDDKGISRIDSGSTHGWFVRGYRNSRTFSKLFSDRKCGSKEKSLEQARAFRDELLQKLADIPKKGRQRRFVTRDKRNKTGVIGVTKVSRKGKDGKSIESYSVSWRPSPGIQKCTSFSIRKYGEAKAFELAVAHRKKMIKLAYGDLAEDGDEKTEPHSPPEPPITMETLTPPQEPQVPPAPPPSYPQL